MLRLAIVSALAVVLAACQPWRPALVAAGRDAGTIAASATAGSVAGSGPVESAVVLSGHVDWSGVRQVQTTPDQILGAATVSFIDTTTSTTVATAKTDGTGAFMLSLAGFIPVPGRTYLVEAMKGLSGHAPGYAAARFRTIVQWNTAGTAWLSCTNAAPGGAIVINALTTALAIESALDSAAVRPENTIGKVNASVSPAVLNATPTYSGHSDDEIRQLARDLLDYLGAEADPVASVGAIAPAIRSVAPNSASGNALVRIAGSGFSPTPLGNVVTIGGVQAMVILATPTSLVVSVPIGVGAGTAPIKVKTGRGEATDTSFVVVGGITALAIDSFAPTRGWAGQKVVLSGRFGANPGNVSIAGIPARIESWSDASISVTVPYGATTSPWKVETGASSATSTASYEVATGEHLGFFRFTAADFNFPFPWLYGENKEPVVANGYVYVLGGQRPNLNGSGQSCSDEVFRLKVLPDSTLGPFQRAGTLTMPLQHMLAAHIGDYLYVFGGHTCGPDTNVVQRARIFPDGSLGPFSNYSTLKNSTGRHAAGLAVVNGYVFILGGWSNNSIERARIKDAAGNLDPFEDAKNSSGAPVSLPGQKAWARTEVVGNRIYTMGGDGPSSSIYITTVNADGSIASVTTNPKNLVVARYAHGSFVYGGAIYNVGGQVSGGGFTNTIERATVKADGTLETGSSNISSFNTGRYVLTPTVVGDRIYIWGGYNGNYLQSVETAAINPDGSIQAWRPLGQNTATWGQAAALVGDRIYRASGMQNGNIQYPYVEQATVQPDGGLSPWRIVASLNTPRHHFNLVRVGNFLYAVGGHDGTTTATTIERAAIQPDNSIGAFVRIDQKLIVPRHGASAKVVGQYLYVTGGYSYRFGYLDSVERARILDETGNIGPFEQVQGVRLGIARNYHGFHVIGRYGYIIGGYNGSYLNAVERTPILDDEGNLGPFVPHAPMPIVSHGHDSDGAAVVGNYFYVFGGYNGSGPDNRVMRAPISSSGLLGAWENLGGLLNLGRWHHSVVVTDGFVYLMNGINNGAEGRVEVAAWR